MERNESFLERWARIVRQKLAGRSRVVDDPAEAIDVLIGNALEAIGQSRNDLVAVTAAEKRLQAMVDEFGQRRVRYEDAARGALASGNADLAKTNVRRAIAAERLQREGQSHLVDVAAQRRELAELIEDMRADYDRLRLRREAVNALATGARAAASGQEATTAAGPAGAERERSLEAARETLARLRARAGALAELRSTGALDAVGAGEGDAGAAIADAEVEQRLRALPP